MGYRVPFIIWFPDIYRHLSPWGTNVVTSDVIDFADLPATLLSLAGVDIPEYMDGTPLLGSHSSDPKKYTFGALDRSGENLTLSRSISDGEYIFNIDADEIPQEFLVHMVNKIINDDNPPDLIAVPRINICPGYTQSFLKKHSFSCNQMGWINWPDYQGRVYRRELLWGGKVHERIQGATRPTMINADPTYSLWHVKSTIKQDKQNELYDTII